MNRVLPTVGVAVVSLALAGCGGVWDTVSSRSFRKDPLNQTYRLFSPEDPVAILRADPPRSGDERAKAMHRLAEPAADPTTAEHQDEVFDLLARTATSDTSPVLRLAAVEALGRFRDLRAAGVLALAYEAAHGRPDGAADPAAAVAPAGARVPRASLTPLAPPTGFAPGTVATIRCRALEALGRTGRAEAVPVLAVAAGGAGPDVADADDREVRLAAVRGLGACRHPDAVAALAKVLAADTARDPAVAGRAHDGLVRLTGKRLPPDPQQWNAVVQAGFDIAPEPTWAERQVEAAAAWIK